MLRINCENWDAQINIWRNAESSIPLEIWESLAALTSTLVGEARKARKAEKDEAVRYFLENVQWE